MLGIARRPAFARTAGGRIAHGRIVHGPIGYALTAGALILSSPARAQTTERASLAWDGSQATLDSLYPAISGDGRFVGFFCRDSHVVLGDTNGASDAFLRDLSAGTTERVSVSDSGGQANDDCFDLSISEDGRFVTFWSYASNLVPGTPASIPTSSCAIDSSVSPSASACPRPERRGTTTASRASSRPTAASSAS
jgi:hypothetical protein